jgi:hypothetical protein
MNCMHIGYSEWVIWGPHIPGGGGGDDGVRRSTASAWVVVAASIGDRRAARARLEAAGAAEVRARLQRPGGIAFKFVGMR